MIFKILISIIVFFSSVALANVPSLKGWVEVPYKVKAIDLNCDQLMDIVVTGLKTDIVVTLIANTDGTFEEHIYRSVPANVSNLVKPTFNFDIKDINNDCYPDLVTGVGGGGQSLNGKDNISKEMRSDFATGIVSLMLNSKNGFVDPVKLTALKGQIKGVSFYKKDGRYSVAAVARGNAIKGLEPNSTLKFIDIEVNDQLESKVLGVANTIFLPPDAYYVENLKPCVQSVDNLGDKLIIPHLQSYKGIETNNKSSLLSFIGTDPFHLEIFYPFKQEYWVNDIRAVCDGDDLKLIAADIYKGNLMIGHIAQYDNSKNFQGIKWRKLATLRKGIAFLSIKQLDTDTIIAVSTFNGNQVDICSLKQDECRTILVSNLPYGLDLEDLNNDGRLDLIVASRSGFIEVHYDILEQDPKTRNITSFPFKKVFR